MNARKLLLQAIEKLGSTKTIDKISVEEILEEAEVSRKTFYKYFPDKYDLANSVYKDYVTALIAEEYNGHNWREILSKILYYFLEHSDFYLKLWNTRVYGSFFDFFIDYSFQNYSKIYQQNHKNEPLTKVQEYNLWYVTAGNVMVMNRWILDGCQLPVEQLVDEIQAHTPREFYEYLNE